MSDNGLTKEQAEHMSTLSVLVVDDSRFDRELIDATLRKLAFTHIHFAENGGIATSKIQNAQDMRKPFDIIFLDAQMPNRDGQSVLKWIRGTAKMKNQIVIITSGTSDAEAATKLIELRVDGFVVKPVTIAILREKLFNALKIVTKNAS